MGHWKTVAAVAFAVCVGIVVGNLTSRPRQIMPMATVKSAPSAPVVKTALVEKRDLPIFVSGIGHVQALNSALVKSRIDGPIEKVLFIEGETVAAGKPLIEIDPRPYRAALTQAEGQLARDQALYVTAKADFDRAVSLADKGFASRQTFEQREAVTAGAQAAVKIDQAAVDNARLNLDFTTIRAPIAGRIGKRLIDTGNLIHSTDSVALAEIVQTKPISALFTVPQAALPEIREQMRRGTLTVDAISTDTRRPLTRGTLALIGNQVDQQTGTVELKASFDNDDDALWPGQLIEARLTMDVRRDVMSVPMAAIAPSLDGKVVFVVDHDHKVAVRKVTLGPSSEGQAMIESGLQPGERVVIEKLDLLAPGLAVEPEAQAANGGTATAS